MKILPIVLLLFSFALVRSQPVINASWVASPGDNFVLQQANYDSLIVYNAHGLGLTGNNVTWDFSQLTPINAFETISYSGTNDTIIRTDMAGTKTLFWEGDTSLLEKVANFNACGYFNAIGSALLYHFPINNTIVYNTQILVGYAQDGYEGTIYNQVGEQGWGTLLLPGNIQYDSVILLLQMSDTSCASYSNEMPLEGHIHETKSFQWISSATKTPILTINLWTVTDITYTYNQNGVPYSTTTTITNASNNVYIYQRYYYTGLSSIKLNDNLQLYPNPATDKIEVSTSEPNITAMRIYDVMGRLIVQQTYSRTIDVSKFSPGQYILELDSPDGKMIKRFGKL